MIENYANRNFRLHKRFGMVRVLEDEMNTFQVHTSE